MADTSNIFQPAFEFGPGFQPFDHGLQAWTYDPACISAASAPANGNAEFQKIAVRQPMTVSNIWYVVNAAASTVTAGQNFVGLYNGAGALLVSSTASQIDTLVTSTGPMQVPITPQTLSPGYYYTCVMFNGTTNATLGRNSSSLLTNPGLSATGARFFQNGTGLTTSLSSTITLSSNTNASANVFSWWSALS